MICCIWVFFPGKIEGSYPIWVDMISAKKVIGEHGGFHRDSVAVGCFDSPSSAKQLAGRTGRPWQGNKSYSYCIRDDAWAP